MVAGNGRAALAELVDFALNEVAAGALEFERVGPKAFIRRPSRGGYMRSGVQVRELMRREGLSGEVITVFHSGRTGIIHGDDGYEVSFNEESLVVGLAYGDLGIGVRVSYGIFFAAGAKIPTAINVRPASGSRTETTQDAGNAVLERGGGFGVV